MARRSQPKEQRRPCNYDTARGVACKRMAKAGADWCGVCDHIPRGQAATYEQREMAANVRSAAVRDARRDEVRESARDSVAPTELLSQPTSELLDGTRERLMRVVVTQHAARNERGAKGVAARDQADAAMNDYAAHQDAILQRHPDPYGKALVFAVREEAAGPVDDAAEHRQWLAENPDAELGDIHARLNAISQTPQGLAAAKQAGLYDERHGFQHSGADCLNFVAASRAVMLRDGDPNVQAAHFKAEEWLHSQYPRTKVGV